MAGDLGTSAAEVHASAVLFFWFNECTPDRHFAKDAALDARIAARFGDLCDAVVADDAAGWRDTPDTRLAAILLVDQFSRNLHRGTAEAYAADPLGLELALEGIAAGDHRTLPPERCVFLLMPLMHCEDAGVQRFSVRRFEALGRAENLQFARDHADVIARFGRFPSRNAALGRQSTSEEVDYLSRPGAGW